MRARRRFGVAVLGLATLVLSRCRGQGVTPVDRVTFRTFLGALVVLLAAAAGSKCQAGIISGSVQTGTRIFNKNLTTEGTTDWAVWGFANGGTSTSLSPDNRKIGGSGISDLTSISNGNPLRGLGQFGSYGESTFNWSNGTPVLSATGAFTGIQHDGFGQPFSTIGEGFSFTVPADTNLRTVTLYNTVNHGNSELTATLSDGSAVPFVFDSHHILDFNGPDIYAITYAANSAGQSLTVKLVLTAPDASGNNTANVAIQAVDLTFAAVPEPSSLALLALGGGVVAAWRRWRKVRRAS
jgi:hypothetical protein